MQIASWASLWFGLALPAILAMYLLKRKYLDTEVSSHLLWSRVLQDMEANRPWQKLRRHLLLALQLLAAALLVLALMQPWVSGGAMDRGHAVIVLDRSGSMGARLAASEPAGGGAEQRRQTRLEAAKDTVLRTAADYGRDVRITLIAVGASPEVLLSREPDRGRLAAALESVAPFDGRAAYTEALSLAAAITRDDPAAEVRIVTDGQWTEPTETMPFAVPVTVDRIGGTERDADNWSVIRFGVGAAAQAGTDASGPASASAVATVKNGAAAEREAVVELRADDRLIESRRVRLAAEGQQSLSFAGLPPAQVYRLELLAEDALPADNVAYAFPAAERPPAVLLVTPGNVFLEKAIRLSGAAVLKIQTDGAAVPPLPQSPVDWVVLDGAEEASWNSAAWEEWLRTKPVWRIRGPENGSTGTAPAGEYELADHPVTRLIRLQDTHIARFRQASPPDWGRPIVTSGASALVYAGEEGGYPRLSFQFDLRDSDLPLRPDFPILVQNIAEWFGQSRAASLGRATAGELRDIPSLPEAAQAEWIVRERPGEAGVGAAPLPAVRDGAQIAVRQPVPERAGLYRWVEKDAEGRILRERWLEAAIDPRESDLSLQASMAVSAGPASGSGAQAQDEAPGAGAFAGPRTPLLPWIVLLALAVILAEWGVYRRGSLL